jgi:hypothetical protein
MTNLEAGCVILAACSLITSVSTMFLAFRANDLLKVTARNLAISREILRRLAREMDAPRKTVP